MAINCCVELLWSWLTVLQHIQQLTGAKNSIQQQKTTLAAESLLFSFSLSNCCGCIYYQLTWHDSKQKATSISPNLLQFPALNSSSYLTLFHLPHVTAAKVNLFCSSSESLTNIYFDDFNDLQSCPWITFEVLY